MNYEVELLKDSKATVGEGPSWDAANRRLLWVDIMGKAVHVFDPASGLDRALPLNCEPGTIVPRASGGAVLATSDGFAFIDLDSGALEPIVNLSAEQAGHRFNDGKCDPQGRFWAGTMFQDASRPLEEWAPLGVLYRLDTNLQSVPVLKQTTIPNGLTWSPDGKTFYFIDSPKFEVQAFDYDPASGALENPRRVVKIPAGIGFPDGMTADLDGNLWIAHFGTSYLSHWDPRRGELLGRIVLPVSYVTSCVFGGAAMDELFITTARVMLDAAALAKQPLAGGLFRAKPGVRGVPSYAFRG